MTSRTAGLAGLANTYVATTIHRKSTAEVTIDAIAELIVDGHTRAVDLAAFDPARAL